MRRTCIFLCTVPVLALAPAPEKPSDELTKSASMNQPQRALESTLSTVRSLKNGYILVDDKQIPTIPAESSPPVSFFTACAIFLKKALS